MTLPYVDAVEASGPQRDQRRAGLEGAAALAHLGGGEPQGRGTGGGGLWHVKTGLLSVQQTADSTGCKRKKNSLQLWAALFDRRGEESSVISPSHTNTHARARTQYR